MKSLSLRAVSVLVLALALSTGVTLASDPAALSEVQNLRFTNKTTFEWDPVPGTAVYNVYRDDIGDYVPNWGSCFPPGAITTSRPDPSVPSAGQGWFYLVTAAAHGVEEGTKGDYTFGERANPAPCVSLPEPPLILDRVNPNGPVEPDGTWQGVNAPRNPGIANDLTGLAGGGLYLHTLEFFAEEVDLEIPGRGFNWRHVRHYRSQINHDGQQGRNWTFNYDRRLVWDAGSILHIDGTGREDRYVLVSGSRWEPEEPGIYNKLRQNPDGTYTLRERDGMLYHYESLAAPPDLAGRLTAIQDRLGNTMTFLYNPPSHNLCTVVDTLGRTIRYFWNDQGRLQSVVDYTGREARYEYDSVGNLISARAARVTGTSTGNDFPDGKTTLYTYSPGAPGNVGSHNLLTITAPGDASPVLVNTYGTDPFADDFEELLSQTYGGGGAGGTYTYAVVPSTPGPGFRQTTVTDRNGIDHVFVSDLEGHVVEERVLTTLPAPIRPSDPAQFVTQHTYNSTGERTETVHPEGNRVLYGYNEHFGDRFQRGNLLSITRVADQIGDGGRGDGFDGTLHGGPIPDIVVEYEYEPLYNQQRTIASPLAHTCWGSGAPCASDGDCGGGMDICILPDTYTFDYQEGDPSTNGVADLFVDWAIVPSGIPLNLGDQNGDTLTDQIFGNPVRLDQRANLIPGGRQAGIEGGLVQPIETRWRYNTLGQVEVEIDPEGNVKVHEYYPEIDPDGDSVPSDDPLDGRTLDPVTGGYLAAMTLDADPSSYLSVTEIDRRDNDTNPTPAEIRNDYSYDPVGNLISSIDGNGVQTSYEVNPLGQIVSVRRGATSARSINLDPDPPLEGVFAEQIYNARDEIVGRRVQDLGDLSETGGVIEANFVFDILGNVVEMSREVGGGIFATTTYRYDAQENRTSTTFPEGNTHTFQFDERNLLYRLVRGDDDLDASNVPPAEASLQIFDYDGNGNPVRFVDGNDTPWEMTYDGFDRRVTADLVGDDTLPIQWLFGTAWSPDENVYQRFVVDTTDLGSATWLYRSEFLYDAMGRTILTSEQIIRPGGTGVYTEDADFNGWVDIHKEFDRNGRLTRSYADDTRLAPTLFHAEDVDYDGAGRVIHKVDALGNEVSVAHDKNNNVLTTTEIETDPDGILPDEIFATTNTYDRLNRLASTTDNAGNEKLFTYDSRDNLIELTDALLNVTTYTYDGLDRRIETRRDPEGLDIPYTVEYDLNGRAVRMTDPEGNPTEYEYDGLGRKTLDRFADLSTIQYVYDDNDNVVQITDAQGTVIDITYDASNRPTFRATSDPGTYVRSTQQTFDYDAFGRLVYARNHSNLLPDVEVTLEYDSLNRIRSETSELSSQPPRTLTYTYDGNGNRLTATYPSGVQLSYSYDPLNRMIGSQDTSVTTDFSVSYEYFGPERIVRTDNGNGTYTDIVYDNLKRRDSIRHSKPGSTFGWFDYEYDAAGNITEERRQHDIPDDTFDYYQYDNAYRLVMFEGNATFTSSGQTIAYTLDKVGNWLQRVVNGTTTLGSTPNELNEYGEKPDDGFPDDFDDNLAIPGPDGVNLAHHNSGNLFREFSSPFTGQITSYYYDDYNRLLEVWHGPEVSPVKVAQYGYDALNRRIIKEDPPGGTGSRFVYDGDTIVAEYAYTAGTEGALRKRFFGGAGGEVVAGTFFPGSASVHYLHHDARGSTRMATSSSESVQQEVRYGPYGEPIFISSFLPNPFLYTGQYYDEETGFYEKRGAVFAPHYGRHIQRFVPGQHVGPQAALNVPMRFPCPINWIGMMPFWWDKGWFWHPGAWHCGWWAWKPHWWWTGAWGWWWWQPWLWLGVPFYAWWVVKPWFFWWHLPFPWWGWQAWWPWGGWWGFWPFWGWFGWCSWLPAWGWASWHNWWPWWGWAGWSGWWPTFGWWGWSGWWPWWNLWWSWHPWWWWGWWTWAPFWWHGYWGWSGWCFWRWCWGWIHWWPWGWWNWLGWMWWWGWFDWNPWWWGGWWNWWYWGWMRGYYWWWGPFGWGPWFCGWWPWWWWGWWAWLVPWGCWFWRVAWLGLWGWVWGLRWWWGWWLAPWWGWFLWWGWWWPWWGWWA